jgi:class 3 adenylate cyclase
VGGQVLVCDAVQRATAQHITYRALPPLQLKGFARPVPAFEVGPSG